MKQWSLLLLIIFTLIGCIPTPSIREERPIALVQAIYEAAQEFINKLDEGTSVFVLNFNSSSPDFTGYFTSTIEHALVFCLIQMTKL